MKSIYIKSLAFILAACFVQQVAAQQFINKATVEYEVKTNLKKSLGESPWAEMMKDNLPTYKTAYYNFTFSGDKSIYKFSRWDESTKLPEFMRSGDENNSWYFDHGKQQFIMKKNVVGSDFDIADSIPHIQWRYTNDSRVIAGFNCRKAIGKIFDSVYVFVFYTDEITISGGPCTMNGLPGLILGMTIPRMYSSWIATKVSVNGVDESSIKATAAKSAIHLHDLRKQITDRAKEWNGDGDADAKNWLDQFVWGASL
jgi:GLPGLI family protein